jgi:hypothetical protein
MSYNQAHYRHTPRPASSVKLDRIYLVEKQIARNWHPINGVCCKTFREAKSWLDLAYKAEPFKKFRIASWIRDKPLP